jgi:mRNA-degrading endonuclease toxin of MazEF toxin-antitoxin module
MSRGDIVLVEFAFVEGGNKRRPALVVQSDALTTRLVSLIVAAISSNLRHAGQPTQAVIDPAVETSCGLRTASAVKCEVLFTADRRSARVIGSLSAATMSQINDCLKVALELP